MKNTRLYQKGILNDSFSSSILCIAAYLFVLLIMILSTGFITFTHQVSFPISHFEVNFEKSFYEGSYFWSSSENILTIFSFPILIIFSTLIISLVFLKYVNNKALQLFMFWVAFHSIVRIFGDFISGHIFDLWGLNLVSDFLRITYPSVMLKLTFIVIAFISSFFAIRIMINGLKLFYDPYKDEIDEFMLTKITIPLILLIPASLVWILPGLSVKEISITVLALILGLYLSGKFKRIRFFVDAEMKKSRHFTIRLNLRSGIIILMSAIIIRLIFYKEIYINSSNLSSSLLDTVLLITLVSALVLFIFSILLAKRYQVYRQKKADKRYAEQESLIETEVLDESLLEGTKWDIGKKSD